MHCGLFVWRHRPHFASRRWLSEQQRRGRRQWAGSKVRLTGGAAKLSFRALNWIWVLSRHFLVLLFSVAIIPFPVEMCYLCTLCWMLSLICNSWKSSKTKTPNPIIAHYLLWTVCICAAYKCPFVLFLCRLSDSLCVWLPPPPPSPPPPLLLLLPCVCNCQRLPWNYSTWWEFSRAHLRVLLDTKEGSVNVIMMRSAVISRLSGEKEWLSFVQNQKAFWGNSSTKK